MKTFKKALCVMLSVLMAFSCVSVAAFAEGGETVSSSLKFYTEKSDAYNAEVTLNKIDEVLADIDICKEITIIESVKLVVDLRNINALCKTIDDYIGIIKTVLFFDPFGVVLGDLKDLELGTWQKGMKRTGDDILILKELIELAEANKDILAKICDASINLGVFANFINISDILGEDGVSGMLKELLFGIVYEDGSEEFDEAYNAYKDDVDSFIYYELLEGLANSYLPGFSMNEESTIEELICLVFSIAVDNYVVGLAKNINFDFSSSGNPALKALSSIVNLKGSTYDFTNIFLDPEEPLLDQLNGLFGEIVVQMVPLYEGWDYGSYEKLGENIENVCQYICTESGLIPEAEELTFDEIMFRVLSMVLSKLDLGAYVDGFEECENFVEMADVLAINIANNFEIGVDYDGSESYLEVAGDLLAYWAYNRFDIRDLNGKVYQAGGGKDIFEVLNFFLNYFLFEKGGATTMGLSTSKSETVFVKLDKIFDYFGKTKEKGVSFNSKEFLLGNSKEKGLLDAMLTLDIDALLDLTVVPALNAAGDVSAVEFIYNTIQYFLNNWAGKTLFPEYQNQAFTNALSNSNIANMVSVLLETVNARKSAVITLATFVAGLIMKDADNVYTVNDVTVEECVATGNRITPKATVNVDGKKLTQGKDYIVISDAVEPGTANAIVKFIGMYDGELERSFDIKMDSVNSIDFTSNTNSVKLVWNEVAYADGYNIYIEKNGSYSLVNEELVTAREFTVSGLKGATEYSFKIEAVSALYGSTQGKTVNVATVPDAVVASGIKTITDASRARLIWQAVPNATHYKIEKYIGSNKWQEVLVSEKTDVIVGGLDSYTEYNFRISAMKKTSDGGYSVAAPTSVKVKTSIGAISSLTASYTSNSITLKWSEVKNTEKYQILQNVNGSWKQIAVVNAGTLSYKITGLKVATKYNYAVRAAVKSNGKWVFGGYKAINQFTGLAKPATFKVSSTNATQAKLIWSKVASAKGYEVFQYINGKWVSKGVTKNTSAVIGGLPSGTNTYFKVRAVTIVDGAYHYGDATGHIAALTLPGKVNNVKLIERSTNYISFSWSKTTGAAGYQVFRYYNGKWVSLGTTTATSWKDSRSMTRGVEYQYKVRAVQKVGSSYKYGAASDVFKAKTTLTGTVRF